MSDEAKQSAEPKARESPTPQPQLVGIQEQAAPTTVGAAAAAARILTGAGSDGVPRLRRLPTAQRLETILALQRTVGNAAVQRALRRLSEREPAPENNVATAAAASPPGLPLVLPT